MNVLPEVRYESVPVPAPTVLRTGVPLFLGRAELPGPTWYDSGSSLPDGVLGHVVRGFFANGGRVCCVVPYARDGKISEQLQRLQETLDSVAAFDQVDLVCAPELVLSGELVDVPGLQAAILADCARHGARFAVLDAVDGTAETVVAQSNQLGAAADTAWGALYHPWLTTVDAGQIPPSGHVAGVYAQLDQRVGTHRAPANTPMEDVTGLTQPVGPAVVSRLTDAGVNPIMIGRGSGVRIWGARTIGGDDIAVRRTVLTVTRWLDRFLAGLVFEPNDPRLWNRVTRETAGYLRGLYDRGALRGARPEEAFFVRCDTSTNPPAVVAAGRVVTQVGLALTRPAEFIQLRVLHGAGAVEVQAA